MTPLLTLRTCSICAIALVMQVPITAADLSGEIQTLFANGAWKRAISTLEKAPDGQNDPTLKELLAMAYLYSASDIDTASNLGKARTLMKQSVDSGGRARFLVSLGKDKKKEAHLLDAVPGELVVTSGYVEFQAQAGSAQAPQRWEKKDISECAMNSKYGKTSNSFHLTVGRDRDKAEQNFRPWHFSADEANLVCSLVGVQAPPARR